MEVKAYVKNLRISPKKVRLVIGLVRGKKVNEALNQLKFLGKKSAQPINDLIKSAIANAEHNYKLDKDNLFIKQIFADQGMVLRRFLPRAHGRATPMLSKFSSITVVLAEINPTTAGAKKTKGKKGATVKVASREDLPGEEVNEEVKSSHNPAEELKKEKGVEHVDPRMEGKHRHNQHADQRAMKSSGGAKQKKYSRQKAG